MKFTRFTLVLPIALTFLALVALALGPGSQPTTPELVAAVAPESIGTDFPVETVQVTATATSTDVPLPTATATATFTPVPRTATPLPAPTHTSVISRTNGSTPRTARVPVLMYHYISVPPADADKYRQDLSVTPEAFAEQLAFLALNGYHPIRLIDLADYLLGGAPLPDRPVVLTFDDGYSDNYANAFPLLARAGFPATFFVITNFVEENRWGYLNWTQLAEMAQAGMEIGSHTLDHPDLKGKSLTYQNAQIAGSKQLISSRLSQPVMSFSYPAGKFDANTTAALKAAGYSAAVVETQGARQSSEAIFELQRIRVRGGYTLADFERWLKYYAENGK